MVRDFWHHYWSRLFNDQFCCHGCLQKKDRTKPSDSEIWQNNQMLKSYKFYKCAFGKMSQNDTILLSPILNQHFSSISIFRIILNLIYMALIVINMSYLWYEDLKGMITKGYSWDKPTLKSVELIFQARCDVIKLKLHVPVHSLSTRRATLSSSTRSLTHCHMTWHLWFDDTTRI